MTRKKPDVCERCKQKKLTDQDCSHSFDHGDFWLCSECAYKMRQEIEDSIRDSLGMDPDDPVTLG